MELLQMKYFLAVAREENISKAAEQLFITQPSLTRQIQAMEKEVGCPLFVRGARKTALTSAGLLLKKQAEELLALYEKAQSEWLSPDDKLQGDIYIGGGETRAMEILMNAAQKMRASYPDVKVHIYSGDISDVCEKLDKGLVDFGLLIEPADIEKYDSLALNYTDKWGLIMPKEHFLAQKEFITPSDLSGIPLIQSRHSLPKSYVTKWYNGVPNIKIVGTYNLINNAAFMARQGIGCVLGLEGLADVSDTSGLTFRPLVPEINARVYVVWKKYQTFSKTSQYFLNCLKESDCVLGQQSVI